MVHVYVGVPQFASGDLDNPFYVYVGLKWHGPTGDSVIFP